MLIILAAIIMGKVASMEGRSSIGWGIFIDLCLHTHTVIWYPSGDGNDLRTMFAMNLMQNDHQAEVVPTFFRFLAAK